MAMRENRKGLDTQTGPETGADVDTDSGQGLGTGAGPSTGTGSGAGTVVSPGPGKVYLVGAGPGDPDLITVRGAQLLGECEALVYDSLVSGTLVDKSAAVEKIYVGKTEGGHAVTQDEITRLLVDLALRPGGPRRILRLKGGDPYVFGRGGEEALACAEAGIPFEVVPGVTAGVAAPAYAGVPVTHRSLSRGVIFFTGHLAHGNLEHLPWNALARSGFTLVSYMGTSTLAELCSRLMDEGLEAGTPALVVQEGTMPGQRSVQGTVGDIAARAREAGIRSPAVTVMGPVVALAQTLGPQRPRALAGKTVVLVKAEESSYEELEALRQEGARVIETSVVRCVAMEDHVPLVAEVERIGKDDVVLFTSAMAARFFGEIWHTLPSRPHPQVIAASPTIREAALRQGFAVWGGLAETDGAGGFNRGGSGDGGGGGSGSGGGGGSGQSDASHRHAEAVRSLIDAAVPTDRTVWLPRSAAAGDAVPRALREAGYRVRPLPIYRAVPVPLPADVRSLLAGGRVDAVLFLSGSTVRAALDAAPALARASQVIFGAVGPLAAREAEAHGIRCQVIPARPTVADLVDTLMVTMKRRGDLL